MYASSAEQHCRLSTACAGCHIELSPLLLCQPGTACGGSSMHHACMSSAAITRGLLELVPALRRFCMLSSVNQQSLTLVPSLQEGGQGQGARAQSGSRRVRTERQRSRQHLDTKFRSHFKQVGAPVSVTAGACHRSAPKATH